MLRGQIEEAEDLYPKKIQPIRVLHSFWDNLRPILEGVSETDLEELILSNDFDCFFK